MRAAIAKSRLIATVVGMLGLVGLIVAAILDVQQAAHAYLWAFLWICALPLGSLAFLMIHHMTGGEWGQALHPLLRAAAATTPFLILLFIPVALSLPELYAWARPEEVAASKLWQHRQWYINPTAYRLRSVGAFLLWSYLAWRLQSTGGTATVQKVASGGLVAHLLLTGLLSVDWLMSLEEHFFSTIFGLLLMVLQALCAYSMMVALACWRQRKTGVDSDQPFYDLGGLLLASVMLLSYLSFSQIVIIWAGNLPDEISWMASRVWGPWKGLAVCLLGLQLFFPFLLLMWGGIKRSVGRLGAVAATVAALGPVHFFWMVIPSYQNEHLGFHWSSLAAPGAVFGLWWVAFSSFWIRMEVRK